MKATIEMYTRMNVMLVFFLTMPLVFFSTIQNLDLPIDFTGIRSHYSKNVLQKEKKGKKRREKVERENIR